MASANARSRPGPSREQGDTTHLLDSDLIEMLLEPFHQSGVRVGSVVQRSASVKPTHQSCRERALRHIALHEGRAKQRAAWIEQGLQIREDRPLVWPRGRQAVHHVIQGD